VTLTTLSCADTGDILGGSLGDLSQAGGEIRSPKDAGTGSSYIVPISTSLATFTLLNSTANSALGTVVFTIIKAE